MYLLKINSSMQSLIFVCVLILMTGCVSQRQYASDSGQNLAKIAYNPYIKGTLFLAGDINCSSLFGLSNNQRPVTPIIHAKSKLKVDTSVSIPTSDMQVFLATTETLIDNSSLKLWFKFPVKVNKYYNVSIEKNQVEKKLLNLDGYKYNSYQYSISVIDELGQLVDVESVSSPNDTTLCDKTKSS